MDFVKIAEELPNLIAEMIFNHIRTGSGSKSMVVTGKLHIDLVEVILEVSLNHSLQVAASVSQDVPVMAEKKEESHTVCEEMQIVDNCKKATNDTGDKEKIGSPAQKVQQQSVAKETSNATERKKASHSKPADSVAKSITEKENSKTLTDGNSLSEKTKEMVTLTPFSDTSKILPRTSVDAKAAGNVSDRTKVDTSPDKKVAKSTTRGDKMPVQESLKSAAKGKIAQSDSVPSLSQDRNSKMSSIKSPVKSARRESASSVTPVTKTTKQGEPQHTGTTRSGRKILKPKRIWNADMAASEVALTQRTTSASSTIASTSSSVESSKDESSKPCDEEGTVTINIEPLVESDDDADWTPHQEDETDDNEVSLEVDNDQEMLRKDLTNVVFKMPEKTKWKPFECSRCDAAFRSFVRLKEHSLDAHKIDLSLENNKNDKESTFPCAECGKTFSRRQNLREHIFVHDKNTIYKCTMCNKTFATQGKLTKHNKTWHSDDSKTRKQSEDDGSKKEKCPRLIEPPRLESASLGKISNAHCNVCNRLLETYMCPDSGVTCPTCKLDFVSPPLEGAVMIPDPDNQGVRFQCTFCEDSKFTGNEECLRNHLYEKHTELLNHTCPFCEIKFVHIETLNMHLLQQHPNRAYKKRSSVGANGEGDNQELIFARWRKMYFCGSCEKIYHTRMRLHDHVLVHHENKEFPYECSICNKRFLHKDVLTQHSRFSHANEWFKVCDQCGKFFRKRVEFENHRHEDNPWRCEVCDKPFTSYSGFRVHMRKHRELPSLMCKYCGEMFHFQSFLTNHERTHTGEKPYECTVCHRKFGNMYTFNKHKKRHYNKKIKCPSCPQTFMYPSDLRAHEKTHVANRERYECSFCECSYLKISSLRTHMKVKHNLDMVEMSMEQVAEQVAEHVSMEVDLDANATEGLTLYSCVTCSTCYYSEEECIRCQVGHAQDPPTAVTVVTQ